jgi:hypothetical protein
MTTLRMRAKRAAVSVAALTVLGVAAPATAHAYCLWPGEETNWDNWYWPPCPPTPSDVSSNEAQSPLATQVARPTQPPPPTQVAKPTQPPPSSQVALPG